MNAPESAQGGRPNLKATHRNGDALSKVRQNWSVYFRAQFTRPQGARPLIGSGGRRAARFNSRARKGRDSGMVLSSGLSAVSIHAPARGATATLNAGVHKPSVSIHAPARGATIAFRRDSVYCEFQFTRPQGARQTSLGETSTAKVFQFTRPQGARPGRARALPALSGVSIHAPARGATRADGQAHDVHRVSIHAPARGATAIRYAPDEVARVSIHAPARGATRDGDGGRVEPRVSIHAPARGATLQTLVSRLCLTRFQFTRPQGARH